MRVGTEAVFPGPYYIRGHTIPPSQNICNIGEHPFLGTDIQQDIIDIQQDIDDIDILIGVVIS